LSGTNAPAYFAAAKVKKFYHADTSFTFPPTLIVGAVYKVNVYAVVEAANQVHVFSNIHWRRNITLNDTQFNDTQHNDNQYNDTQHNDNQYNDAQHNDT
jgi:hypothetical protein